MSVTDELQFEPVGAHSSGQSIATVWTPTRPAKATKILVQVLDQHARYTLDGTDPTTTSGFQLTRGNDPYIIPIHPNATFKIIEESATCDLELQWGK